MNRSTFLKGWYPRVRSCSDFVRPPNWRLELFSCCQPQLNKSVSSSTEICRPSVVSEGFVQEQKSKLRYAKRTRSSPAPTSKESSEATNLCRPGKKLKELTPFILIAMFRNAARRLAPMSLRAAPNTLMPKATQGGSNAFPL